MFWLITLNIHNFALVAWLSPTRSRANAAVILISLAWIALQGWCVLHILQQSFSGCRPGLAFTDSYNTWIVASQADVIELVQFSFLLLWMRLSTFSSVPFLFEQTVDVLCSSSCLFTGFLPWFQKLCPVKPSIVYSRPEAFSARPLTLAAELFWVMQKYFCFCATASDFQGFFFLWLMYFEL